MNDKPLLPAQWVGGFSILVLCQLAGEALVRLCQILVPALVFPAPVAGMLILLLVLLYATPMTGAVMGAADGLLGILSLLFIPSAVGIMQHAELLRSWGVALIVAVLASTLLTLLVTVGAFIATEKVLARGSR